MKKKHLDLLRRFESKKEEILNKVSVDLKESKTEQRKRIDMLLQDYEKFALYYFPHYCKGKPAPFHIQLAKDVLASIRCFIVKKWPRAHAKSVNVCIILPIFLMLNKELYFMVLASANQDGASGLLADLQAELSSNPRLINDFGEFVQHGRWEFGDFTTRQGVRFKAIGRGGKPRGLREKGNRPDYIAVDDIDDDELCLNPKRVDKTTDWVLSALYAAFSPKGRARFIVVANLISRTSVLQSLCDHPKSIVEQIDALDKKGNPAWDYYSKADIKGMMDTLGFRLAQRELFHNPISEGKVFKQEHFQYKKRLPFKDYHALVCYTDPSFKDGGKNDHKATILIGVWKGEYHILMGFVEQTSIKKMVDWHYEINAFVKGEGAVYYYMEANFIQDLLLKEFDVVAKKVGYSIPIKGDKRKKPNKFARIEAMSPLFERGKVFINIKEKDNPHIKRMIEQFILFERGSRSPDDAPDAVEGAIYQLNKKVRVDDTPTFIQHQKNTKYRF